MNDIRTALVVGGGIAGPVSAMALQKAGIAARVCEAYPSAADGVGGGLSIAPNGLDALAVLGADDVITSIGTPMSAIVIESWNGKRLAEFATPQDLPSMQFVWRPELYRALHEEAARRGIQVEHGKRLVAFDDDGDCVRAQFDDGTRLEADILIGADGIHSTVRSLIDPAAPAPRYAGLFNLGGRVRQTAVASTGDRMHMSFGKRAFFGYAVADDGSGGWFVNLPQRQPMTLAQGRAINAEQWLDSLGEVFAQDRGPAAELLRGTHPADLLVVGPMEDLPTVPTWSRGRAVLVGDAAHAASPSSGQGASLAIESSLELARCLRDLPHSQAFTAYEQLRRARVEKIIKMAARTNRDKAAGPVARVLRDALLPLAMRVLAKPEKMAWQFAYQIDWDARTPLPTS